MKLPRRIIKIIEERLSSTFESLKSKLLVISGHSKLNLPGIYTEAAKESGGFPDLETLQTKIDSVSNSLDSVKYQAINRATKEAEAHLQSNTDPQPEDVEKVLREAWKDTLSKVKLVVETEATSFRNAGLMEGIIRVAASRNISDPDVAFITSKDASVCPECIRIHTINGTTPRVYKFSEISHGYVKRGTKIPSWHGMHPNCLTGSQRIHTDRGMLTAKELFDLGTPLTVTIDRRIHARRIGNNQYGAEISGKPWLNRHDSGSYRRQATSVYDTGIQECYKIELDSGHILEVSSGHEMWVDDDKNGKKVPAFSIKIGDKIPLLSGPGDFGTDRFPELAELMGNLMGDGCLHDRAQWIFFGNDIEYGLKLRNMASKFAWRLKLGRMKIQLPNEKYNVCQAGFTSMTLARIFKKDFGLSKKPRRVPARLWGADKETVAAFIRGLYAADGHVECSSPAVVIAQNDKEFLIEIQQLLSNFGLASRMYKHGVGCSKIIKYANGDTYETQRKPAWRLHIGGWEQVNLFSECIGMGVSVKNERLARALKKFESRNRLGAWRTAHVVGVTPIGFKQTYCLTEPITNTITVNGIVTGQCRCSPILILPNFGFKNGRLSYISKGYDVYEDQHGAD
jgi:LAGLIDADG-like domain